MKNPGHVTNLRVSISRSCSSHLECKAALSSSSAANIELCAWEKGGLLKSNFVQVMLVILVQAASVGIAEIK